MALDQWYPLSSPRSKHDTSTYIHVYYIYLCISGDKKKMSPDKFLMSAICDPCGAGRVKTMCRDAGNAVQGRTGHGGAGVGGGERASSKSMSCLFTCCCRRAWLAVGKLDGLQMLT